MESWMVLLVGSHRNRRKNFTQLFQLMILLRLDFNNTLLNGAHLILWFVHGRFDLDIKEVWSLVKQNQWTDTISPKCQCFCIWYYHRQITLLRNLGVFCCCRKRPQSHNVYQRCRCTWLFTTGCGVVLEILKLFIVESHTHLDVISAWCNFGSSACIKNYQTYIKLQARLLVLGQLLTRYLSATYNLLEGIETSWKINLFKTWWPCCSLH